MYGAAAADAVGALATSQFQRTCLSPPPPPNPSTCCQCWLPACRSGLIITEISPPPQSTSLRDLTCCCCTLVDASSSQCGRSRHAHLYTIRGSHTTSCLSLVCVPSPSHLSAPTRIHRRFAQFACTASLVPPHCRRRPLHFVARQGLSVLAHECLSVCPVRLFQRERDSEGVRLVQQVVC